MNRKIIKRETSGLRNLRKQISFENISEVNNHQHNKERRKKVGIHNIRNMTGMTGPTHF